MLLNDITVGPKRLPWYRSESTGYTVGLPVARFEGKRAKHVSILTLLECRLDRSIVRVELVLSEFEPHSVYPRTEVSVRAVCA